jgi:hypothetical protein
LGKIKRIFQIETIYQPNSMSMKKLYVLGTLIAGALVFSYCSSTKKAAAVPIPKISYQANIAPLLEANCAPCHFPNKGGNKKALDSYATTVAQYDDLLRRISLNPTDRGFMPNRKPKLSDSTINVIKQWKLDGMLEK